MLGEILKGPRVFADETSLPTLAPGTGAVKKAWLWAYARDDSTFGGSGPPMVAYRFEDNRSGACVRRHLGGYGGILQVDGYAAYNQLVRKDGGNDGPRLAGCWAHSRRRFYELHTAGDSQVATTTVERMAELWKLEAEVRGQGPEARAAARQAISAPIVAELFALWQQTLPRISGKSKLAEAIRYTIARRDIFERFEFFTQVDKLAKAVAVVEIGGPLERAETDMAFRQAHQHGAARGRGFVIAMQLLACFDQAEGL